MIDAKRVEELREWDGEQPILVRFDEATEWVRERAKVYCNDWIWQERLKAVEVARALLLSPAPQSSAIEGKSGCEMVNCRYAHRNEGGIATCLAPGDSCIMRQDCPFPQPIVTREDADFNAEAIYRADDLGSAKGLMRAMLRALGVRVETEGERP